MTILNGDSKLASTNETFDICLSGLGYVTLDDYSSPIHSLVNFIIPFFLTVE